MKGRAHLGSSAGIAVVGIGALAAISLLVSCVGSNADTAVELRVMSFNIRYGTADDGENSWSHRHQLVKNVIAEQSPDILGTQEALKFQLDELTGDLDGYALIGVGRDDGREAGEYSAILYRSARLDEIESGTFWLSDTPEVPGSKSWGNQITRICTWALLTDRASGSRFYVYNVHLDHQSQAARERAVELIAARIGNRSSPDPVVLTGDFNAGEDNPAMRYLRGEIDRAHAASEEAAQSPRLRDTFRVVQPDSSNVGTFNAFRGDTSGEKIDAVLVSSEWVVSSAAIVRTSLGGRYPSDHFPVVATISLAGTARRE